MQTFFFETGFHNGDLLPKWMRKKRKRKKIRFLAKMNGRKQKGGYVILSNWMEKKHQQERCHFFRVSLMTEKEFLCTVMVSMGVLSLKETISGRDL